MATKTRHPAMLAREATAAQAPQPVHDQVVRSVLVEALAQMHAAAFAIETCAHLRGLERTLLPISEPLRQQIDALARVIDPLARDPDGDRARADADQP